MKFVSLHEMYPESWIFVKLSVHINLLLQAYCGFYSPVEQKYRPAIATGELVITIIDFCWSVGKQLYLGLRPVIKCYQPNWAAPQYIIRQKFNVERNNGEF